MATYTELLQQISDPNLTHDERARLRCRLAKQYEDNGNYKLAREALGEMWRGTGEMPDLKDLAEDTAAEVLLRVGVLSGWLGSAQQIENSQERSKNLISESIRRFEATGNRKKVAEAQAELGVCYWREGSYDEARDVLQDALARFTDKDSGLKAVTLLRLALIENSRFRWFEALYFLMMAVPLFESSTNHNLKGRFHNEYARALRRAGEDGRSKDFIDRALIEYAAASYHFEQAGHTCFQGCVENNLGFLFGAIGKYEEAHQHLDKAQALFTSLSDACRIAAVDETRARVLLAEGKTNDAERVVRNAVAAFERGDEQSMLAEALTTHGTALARLGNVERARLVLQRAIEVAERAGDREGAGRAALAVCEELFAQLESGDLRASYERADELLKDSPHPVNQRRLLDCTRRLLFRCGGMGDPPTWEGVMLDRFADELEARMVERALRSAGGNVTRAARLLGIKRQRLSNMLHTRHRRLLASLAPTEAQESDAGIGDMTAHDESDADDV